MIQKLNLTVRKSLLLERGLSSVEIKVRARDYQDRFLSCESKFPCCKAGIGTGKTLLMLVKIYQYCEKYPGTTALIVRKEFTDLHDSTIKDFQQYFSCKVGSDKNYTLPCGSKIMFRHAAEIEVLKNINLGIAGIEQAEEFEDDKQFQFIRDRLRQNNGATVRPLIIIANANGHNWIHQLWMASSEREEIDLVTGQYYYKKGEYECFTATTFANERNLPSDFILDCRAKEIEAPNHYKQYILNDDDITQQDDFVFTFQELEEARKREYAHREGYGIRLVAYAIGRVISITSELQADGKIIDEDGIGGGPLDVINANIRDVEDQYKGFRNKQYSYDENRYFGNPRTHCVFVLKEMIMKGHISLVDESLCQELLTLRYTFMTDGRRILISKEKLRKEGIKSPNKADSLIMAVSLIGQVQQKQDRQYEPNVSQYAHEDNLFKLAGIR